MRVHTASLTIPVSEIEHVQGTASARVTLVEYGDYECPHCGRAYLIVKAVQRHLGDRLRFVFRNFPLNDLHPHAEFAAESAEAAGAQGKFWEMHDALYEHQVRLGEPFFLETARNLGLDVERFLTDLRKRTFQKRVRDDFMGGVHSGVNGTPSFFINGYRYDDAWDAETLTRALKEASS
jgi:protein-disulfide isomerase